ncbi:MAG: hypothetical protein FRX49_11710 [Trebouxia sp. A1-2]|nr:MAG: hypothetical protein FRX49_11710 [Trebouxia sp. A1-2]
MQAHTHSESDGKTRYKSDIERSSCARPWVMHLKDKPSFCKALLLEAVGQTFKGHTAVGHEQAQGRQQEPELLPKNPVCNEVKASSQAVLSS